MADLSSKAAKKRYLDDMKKEMSCHSPLGEYLVHLRSMSAEGGETADFLEADLIETFQTEAGLRVLKLMEKAVLFRGVPNGSSEGALREINAVRNFVMEIRRLVSNG